MTRTDLKDFYEQRKASFTSALQDTNTRINLISNLRLAAALVFLTVFYFGFRYHDLFYLLIPILVVFAILVRRHASLFSKKTHLENLCVAQRHELHALEGDYSHNSSGSEFIDVHHPFTHDLDVFGESSLFQYINRSNTRGGKKRLADRFSSAPENPEEIRSWQAAVSELAGKTGLRQEVQAMSMQADELPNDHQQLIQWLREPAFVYGRIFYKIILHVFPPITIALVISAFFLDGVGAYALLAAGVQWIFLGFHLKRVNAFHQYVSRKKNMLQNYGGILGVIRNEKYDSVLMKSLGSRAGEADVKVRKLASLVSAFDARLNSMTNLFVNSLLLYDLQCVYRLEKWRDENKEHLASWLDVVCEAEALCSLGTFAFNHPAFSFPDINTTRTLSAVGLGHPLLNEQERVINDFHLDKDHSIMIITGANMAGKSTFLRSVGVNVVLALSGAPVCGKAFSCPLIRLRSGMRTADSLKENQSYFYAELDRLKSIMDELREGTPLLILLDEILKGTNSTDKQSGSVALVNQLVEYPCLVLIATHDLALGDLEKVYPVKVGNYSFEANIENDQLFFDYKLKRGIAQKMNATFLMRKMGIIKQNTTA